MIADKERKLQAGTKELERLFYFRAKKIF